ncbi:aspartate/glutamate/uridylate kinase [Geminicoccaceae bacterium 1502E]|nr:aspartate/glutamate/uridylate kinase [Geminicoccaceae bacterium 1502E]
MNREPLWIVKIGGSLMDAPALHPWLATIAGTEGPARLVVAGGGPFADQVRAAQQRLGFDDLAAHRMAILAMQQYGLALQSLEPRLGLVESAEGIAELRQGGGRAVWLPWRMIGTDRTIEPSWDITSDSLALILARRLAAERLVLVKSATMQAGTDLASLAAAGVVDAAFTRLAAGFEERIAFAHRDAPPLGALFPATSRLHG